MKRQGIYEELNFVPNWSEEKQHYFSLAGSDFFPHVCMFYSVEWWHDKGDNPGLLPF